MNGCRVILFVLLALAAVALVGCDDLEDDLTGEWQPSQPVECTSFLLSDSDLSTLEGDILDTLGVRISQAGSALDLIILDTGKKVSGTISDDEINIAYSETRRFRDREYRQDTEIEGTVLDDDRIALTETKSVTSEAENYQTTCSFHWVRRDG